MATLNKLSIGDMLNKSVVVEKVCRTCGKPFNYSVNTYQALGISSVPEDCPTCCDKKQRQDETDVVRERRCLHEFVGVDVRLPKDLFEVFRANDRSRTGLRAIIKGKDLPGSWTGRSWDGRIDVHVPGVDSPDFLPRVGRVRVMEVRHAAGHKRTERHGVPMGPKEEVEVEYSDTYLYVVIEPMPFADTEPTMALVLASVDYKTTLKGFGRQWHASLDDSRALWSVRLSNQARSGRFGTLGCLAVVDDSHPVVATQTGSLENTREWTFFGHNGPRREWREFPECAAKDAWRQAVANAREAEAQTTTDHLKEVLGVEWLCLGHPLPLDDGSEVELVGLYGKRDLAYVELRHDGEVVTMEVTAPPDEGGE